MDFIQNLSTQPKIFRSNSKLSKYNYKTLEYNPFKYNPFKIDPLKLGVLYIIISQ